VPKDRVAEVEPVVVVARYEVVRAGGEHDLLAIVGHRPPECEGAAFVPLDAGFADADALDGQSIRRSGGCEECATETQQGRRPQNRT
jgi:hypothetical protein